jgi:hypothetical protein
MSAWKPLALGITIWGLTVSVVHADPITWPSGLNNWTIYLAAPSGGASVSPPVSYTVPAPQYTPPQPAPAPPPQPAPVQTAASAPLTVVANTPYVVVPPTPVTVSAPIPAVVAPAYSPPTSTGPVDGYINVGTGPSPGIKAHRSPVSSEVSPPLSRSRASTTRFSSGSSRLSARAGYLFR